MCQKAIYPGSFDPVTYGHIDLIQRAQKIFETVIVAVAHNSQKKPLFSIKERVDMLKKATAGMDGIIIEDFGSLVVDYARKHNIGVIIRGLRMVSDFEYEFQMALTNRKLSRDVETIFLMPSEQYSYFSSRLLKETAFLGADLSSFLPKDVERRLKEKLNEAKIDGAKRR
ncbi:MAG: pantetheine-phosphate adenylyltransferase [Omnitrophica WOR_2 bacterium RIFCSPHIGHO2_02_FULL_45_21]|nr:MAG: pantetheine-phosphate adenylyltransferase [Omnitrophica WOR_2 bacterium RIFCSPHIGHO2_02_FULL_45_21]